MRYEKKFKIDVTINELLDKKNIDLTIITRSYIHFIFVVDKFLQKNTEAVLLHIIENYQKNTIIPLSDKFKYKSINITKEQDIIYNKISRNNRTFILNQLISIAINNSLYINVIDKKTDIKYHDIINKYTLDFFTSFIKCEEIYKELIIGLMQSTLYKLNVSNKKLKNSYYFNELLVLIFKQYGKEKDGYEILENPAINNYLYNELGKIYFIMNIEYNMSLANLSENFRKWKSFYEPILENKYKNNIDKFIKNEFNFPINTTEKIQKDAFFNFFYDIHDGSAKERELFTILLNKYNTLINGSVRSFASV